VCNEAKLRTLFSIFPDMLSKQRQKFRSGTSGIQELLTFWILVTVGVGDEMMSSLGTWNYVPPNLLP